MTRIKSYFLAVTAVAALAVSLVLSSAYTSNAAPPPPGVDVTVVNSSAQPVPLRDVDSPARHAFQKEVELDLLQAPMFTFGEIMVPAGKRLVIEYIAIKMFGDTPDHFDDVSLITTVNGETALYQVMPVFVLGSTLAYDKQVRIYADAPGATVRIIYFGQKSPFARVTVSGHLVDLP